VAIKKLHDFDWFNMETVEEFRREAALAQLLSNHPMVVNFIGACSQAPNFCMVSEFCDQGSLESVLRGKHAVADIPLKTIVRIIRDAAAGTHNKPRVSCVVWCRVRVVCVSCACRVRVVRVATEPRAQVSTICTARG
jgi:serine/threonine protein kinase